MKKIYKGFTSNLIRVDNSPKSLTDSASPSIYQPTRLDNPTKRESEHLEDRIAFLEGGERALLLSSGIAAYTVSIMALTKSGDHIITHADVNPESLIFFNDLLPKMGIEKSFVEATDIETIEASIQDNTKVIFLEIPSNLTINISDIQKISEIAHRHDIKVIVDNTLATSFNQRPLDLGADVVVHFCTKYMNEHNDVTAGIIVGESKFITNCINITNSHGGKLNEFDGWLLQRCMNTLGLRMERQNESTQILAEFLEKHPAVEKVHYPGLKSHPQHELAQKQMRGFGTNLNIELKGGHEMIHQFLNRTLIFNRALNLGSVESLNSYIVASIHYDVPVEIRMLYGITEKLIRLSVGIEEIEDLLNDLEFSLDIN